MKKLFAALIIFFASLTAKSQLTNNKWNGTLQLEQAVDVQLDFRKDTLDAISTAEGRSLETMTYLVKDNILTIQKVSGQSDCNDVAGKYKFELKDDILTLALVEDNCFNRASVLNMTHWTKQK